MKNISNLLNILINALVIIAIIAMSFYNFDRIIECYCPIMQKVYTTHFVYILWLVSVCSYVAGFCLCLLLKSKSDKLCSAYQKRNESITASKDNDTAKIAALQAKIETLETALQSALKNQK